MHKRFPISEVILWMRQQARVILIRLYFRYCNRSTLVIQAILIIVQSESSDLVCISSEFIRILGGSDSGTIRTRSGPVSSKLIRVIGIV